MLGSLAFTAPAAASSPPRTARCCSTVADAVRHHRPVSIRYTAGDGRRSERILHPYGLVVHSGRWYVTGADPGIGEDRTFRLDRIADARTLPGSFEPPAGLDPAAARPVGARHGPVPASREACGSRGQPSRSAPGFPPASRPWRNCRPPAGTAGGDERWLRANCGRSGSTGCRRCSPRSTGHSSSSGRMSSAASSSRSPTGSRPRLGLVVGMARLRLRLSRNSVLHLFTCSGGVV